MKIKHYSLLLLLFGFLCLIYSCQKDDESSPIFIGYEYFPTNVGHTLIYDVEELYADSIAHTYYDSTYQIKEVIESTYNDNQGRPTQRLERYKRLTDSDPWVIYKVWTSNLTADNALKEEDNITFVKLSFPVKENKTWNGNALNYMSQSAQGNYLYQNINTPSSINNLNFDSTLTVTQNLEVIAIYYDLQEEKYATGVGMFSKIQEHTEYLGVTNYVKTHKKYVEKLKSFSN